MNPPQNENLQPGQTLTGNNPDPGVSSVKRETETGSGSIDTSLSPREENLHQTESLGTPDVAPEVKDFIKVNPNSQAIPPGVEPSKVHEGPLEGFPIDQSLPDDQAIQALKTGDSSSSNTWRVLLLIVERAKQAFKSMSGPIRQGGTT